MAQINAVSIESTSKTQDSVNRHKNVIYVTISKQKEILRIAIANK